MSARNTVIDVSLIRVLNKVEQLLDLLIQLAQRKVDEA